MPPHRNQYRRADTVYVSKNINIHPTTPFIFTLPFSPLAALMSVASRASCMTREAGRSPEQKRLGIKCTNPEAQ